MTLAYNIHPIVYNLSLWHSATGLLKLQTDFLGVVIFLSFQKPLSVFLGHPNISFLITTYISCVDFS